MSYPHPLTSLTDREAIYDALTRLLVGIDENDSALFDSAWNGQNVTFDFSGQVISGLDTIRTRFLDSVGKMDTTHITSSVRINIKDARAAYLTCTAFAQHCAPGKGAEPDQPKFGTGSRYFVDVVRGAEDGVWRIERFAMKIVWTQGDASVM